MKYLSVCSGIEAATVAWHPLGWEAFAYSEIEKFPCQVLAHHYPYTPNLGDMTKFWEWKNAAIDVLVGGTPCQSFSIAGLREGLADPRGNLMLIYLAIAAKYRPKWLVWENVPGVLSSNGGKDFASLLRGMAELGYGFAYRVLDAQFFGVAQRRRRVFVVGCLGDWRRAAAVLFERHSLSGNPAPSREARSIVAALTATGVGTCGADDNQGQAGHLVTHISDVSRALTACKTATGRLDPNEQEFVAHSYGIPGNWIGRAPENGGNAVEPMHDVAPCLTGADKHGVAYPINTQVAMRHEALGEGTGMGIGADGDPAFTLQSAHSHAVAFAQNQRNEVRLMDIAGALAAEPGAKQQTYAQVGMQVRRLTPIECERLQGFPDGYTYIKENTPDGPRYKALGNSMAVPVMEWIGRRIQELENIQKERVAA
jgi:DNA (cytosine-5)-methyltransferase 1